VGSLSSSNTDIIQASVVVMSRTNILILLNTSRARRTAAKTIRGAAPLNTTLIRTFHRPRRAAKTEVQTKKLPMVVVVAESALWAKTLQHLVLVQRAIMVCSHFPWKIRSKKSPRPTMS